MAWLLFNWLDGSVIREFESEAEGGDKIVHSIDGNDSAQLSIALESLPAAVRSNWRNEFLGIKHGVCYYEEDANGAPIAIYAGIISPRISLDGETIKLNATSMIDYLNHIRFISPDVDSIEDPNEEYSFENRTGKQMAMDILNFAVNSDPAAPSIAAGNGSGSSATQNRKIKVRDLISVGELLRELLEDPAASEFRFIPMLNASKTELSWRIDFPESGRLFPGSGGKELNLSDPEVNLIDLSPNAGYADYYNSLWNEIAVEEGISIARNDNIPDGYPRYSEYINFSSALTPAERDQQVQARLANSAKPLENWEIEIFDEELYNGKIAKPSTWSGSGSSYLLGREITISDGASLGAEALEGVYRCTGIEFSSHESSVRLQLADIREVYPRMPKRLIERIGSELGKSNDFKIPPSRFEEIPSWYEPEIPDPGPGPGIGDLPNDGWEWGSENPVFPDMPPMHEDAIYGFDIGDPKWSNPFIAGETIDERAGGEGNKLFSSVSAQDNGGGFFSAFVENIGGGGSNTRSIPTAGTLEKNSYSAFSVDSRRETNSLGDTFEMMQLGNNMPRIVISSGKFENGEISNLQRRGVLEFSSNLLDSLYWNSNPFDIEDGILRPTIRSFRTASGATAGTRFGVFLEGMEAYNDRLLLIIRLQPIPTVSNLHEEARKTVVRLITVRKGDRYDDIDTSLYQISPQSLMLIHDQQNPDQDFRVFNFIESFRAGTWFSIEFKNMEHFPIGDEGAEASKDSWWLQTGNLPVTSFILEEGRIKYPYFEEISSGKSWEGNRVSENSTVAKGPFGRMHLFASTEGDDNTGSLSIALSDTGLKQWMPFQEYSVLSKIYDSNYLENYQYARWADESGVGIGLNIAALTAEGTPIFLQYFSQGDNFALKYPARDFRDSEGYSLYDLMDLKELDFDAEGADSAFFSQQGIGRISKRFDSYYFNGWIYILRIASNGSSLEPLILSFPISPRREPPPEEETVHPAQAEPVNYTSIFGGGDDDPYNPDPPDDEEEEDEDA